MRLQGFPAPRVVSISLKARSAITLGGHKPDAVIWLDEADGEWVTSTAFTNAPTSFFADYIVRYPLRGEMGRPWERHCRSINTSTTTRRRIAGAWPGDEDSRIPSRGPAPRWAGPSPMRGNRARFRMNTSRPWPTSAIDTMKLGRGPVTDFLAISFSSLDKVGHDFGPDSHETQDVLVHLDPQLGCCSTSSIGTSAKAITSSGCRPITAWRRCPSA